MIKCFTGNTYKNQQLSIEIWSSISKISRIKRYVLVHLPHLVHTTTVWYTMCKKDIVVLENIHKEELQTWINL